MRVVQIGKVQVSGLCIGGNPFSGFAHQTKERSKEMTDFYTDEMIKQTLRESEEAGINTFFGRTDDHIFGVLKEYWDEGGQIQWFAQVRTERDNADAWRDWLAKSIDHGACGAYIHGGVVDNWYANEIWDNFHESAELMKSGNIAAGYAGHMYKAHAWIRDNLDIDFQMCSYYNPTDRSLVAHHSDEGEKWEDVDREAMLEVISTIQTPVVHYKVFAAGNRPILTGFEYMRDNMRAGDIACVGMFTKDDPEMIRKNVSLFEEDRKSVV
jgi:hypothetical protein